MSDVPPTARRTGLLIPVHGAEEVVGDFRRRHNAESVARRIPPHITVLFPFVRVANLDDAVRSVAASHFGCFAAFDAELTRVGRFDEFVWLAPQPRDRFVELIDATCVRFPQFPPYEDTGIEPEPHLTIAAVDDAAAAVEIAALADRELARLLPFRFAVDCVALFEEGSDGTWHETTRFELA